MPLRRPASELSALTSGVVGLLLLSGCSSNSQFEAIQSQLSQIEGQVRQLQAESSNKAELAALEGRLSDESQRILRADADLLTEFSRLSEHIVDLEQQFGDTQVQIDQLSKQVAEANRKLKEWMAAPTLPATEGGRLRVDASDPEALYQSAYEDHRRGNYHLAILAFREYLDSFPEAEQADNALYWTGESYFLQERYSSAISAFTDLLARYPASDKATSALLRRAFALLKRGDRDEGIDQLRELVREHPSSAEADLASEELGLHGTIN